ARGVEEADRLPLVGGSAPLEVGIALVEQGLVILLAEQRAARVERVVDVDDRAPPLDEGQSGLDGLRELAGGYEQLRLPVLQDERDGSGVQAIIERVQHRA